MFKIFLLFVCRIKNCVKCFRLASLATFEQNKDSWSSSVLITFNEDTIFDPQQILNISFNVNSEFPPGLDVRYTIYIVDNIKTNPMAIWMKNGSPAYPSSELRETLRAHQVIDYIF